MEEILRLYPQAEGYCEHYFAQGVYARALYIPKGTRLTGKIHKYSQINVLLMGDITVLTESGTRRVKPPFIVVSPPGTKRIAYAHEDTIWLTILGTDLTSVEEIEAHFVAETEEQYQQFCRLEDKGGAPCHSAQ